jgi:hypothetical protein
MIVNKGRICSGGYALDLVIFDKIGGIEWYRVFRLEFKSEE